MPIQKHQKTMEKEKVAEVVHEYREGELHVGKSNTIITYLKQARAIALSEANKLEKSKK